MKSKKLKMLGWAVFYILLFGSSAILVITILKNIMKNLSLIFAILLLPFPGYSQTIEVCDSTVTITIKCGSDQETCFVDVVGEVDPSASSQTVYYHIGDECCFYNDEELSCCRNAEIPFPASFESTEQLLTFMRATVDGVGCPGVPYQLRIINIY